ncbi:universal stress protein [Actinomycetospora lutea]|uniref:universal stress protein n=1 Tax=Actinomycetospora lutea TaxID=663604 RepID=UPI00236660E5|nr:universal stress protein [Actinomycetospora lutea]MDD7939625.1 universal stress protein [Actinomycetospora lutea]
MTVTSMGARVLPQAPSVVVGVDDGLLRTRVLDRAVAEARRRDRTVRIVHAHPAEAAGPPDTPGDDDAGARAEAYLRRTAPDLEVRRTCDPADPATALAGAGDATSVLVVGDRRRRLGSDAGRTTEELITIAPCPVLVVPEYRGPTPAGTRRAGVVVGVDDAPGAAEVLLTALRAAETLGESVEVVRAVSEVGYGAGGITRREEDEIDPAPVDALVAAARERVPDVPVEVVIAEDRAARLLLARAAGADLVVLGHRGHTAGHLVGVGSTTRSVLLAAPCPVLVLGPAITVGGPVAGAGR